MGNFRQDRRSSGGRRDNRFGGGGFGRRESNRRNSDRTMYKAVCDQCGRDCELPFKPSSDKPVYCSNCFRDKSEENSNDRNYQKRNNGSRSGFRDKEMFSAVCDNCGKKCEVPFKPTSGKPIFCSDCFEKEGEGNRRSDFNRNDNKNDSRLDEQLSVINEKLDRLLRALELREIKVPENKTIVEEIPEVSEEKSVKKKKETTTKKSNLKVKKEE